MSQADHTPDPDDPRRGMQPRPKRGRAVLIGTFLGLIVMVFLIMTLVSQCSGDDSEDVGAPAAAVVDASAPGPSRT